MPREEHRARHGIQFSGWPSEVLGGARSTPYSYSKGKSEGPRPPDGLPPPVSGPPWGQEGGGWSPPAGPCCPHSGSLSRSFPPPPPPPHPRVPQLQELRGHHLRLAKW